MVEYLYILPSKLLSCELFNGINVRSHNLYHHPIIYQLEKILNLSLYTDTLYLSILSTIPPKLDYSNKTLAFTEYSDLSTYSSMNVCCSNTGTTLITLV